jgi:AcrR family transcriptional regulator
VALLMAEAGASRPTFYLYFEDLYDLMRTLLQEIREAILEGAAPWFGTEEDPPAALRRSLWGLVKVGREQGPILRAIAEAAPFDAVLERAWNDFLGSFDAAVASRIEEHQARGLIAPLPARAVAVALNRMDAGVLIKEFGTPRRGDPELVHQSLCRIWISTLYSAAR